MVTKLWTDQHSTLRNTVPTSVTLPHNQ